MRKIVVTFLTTLLIMFAGLASADRPSLIPNIITQDIPLHQKSSNIPLLIPVEGILQSIKVCSSLDSPSKNIQVKASIKGVWFGSVSQDCTTLDDIGGIDLGDDSNLKLICQNFDSVPRICRIKVVYYTKE